MKFGFPSLALFLLAGFVRADSFDHYTSPHLAKLAASKQAEKVTQIALDDLVTAAEVLPGLRSAFLIVKTNEGRWSKLLVQPARQKTGMTESVPILLIERLVTFREGEERLRHAEAKNIRLFHDFRMNLDIGQVVPTTVASDLRFTVDGEKIKVEPQGKAEIYLVTKHLAEATPAKSERLNVGDKFETRFFNGKFKLYDDGKRSGDLILKVGDKGEVGGFYYSDADGAKYEVEGQVGPNPNFGIQFRVTFPRSVQFYSGWMFTGDARAIAGSSRLGDRETGFYAIRQTE